MESHYSFNKYRQTSPSSAGKQETNKGRNFWNKMCGQKMAQWAKVFELKHENQNLITGTNIKVLEKTDHTTLSSDLHMHTLACAATTLHISYTHRYKHAQLLKIEQKCLGVYALFSSAVVKTVGFC